MNIQATELIALHTQHTHAPNRFAVIPTTEKLNADTALTGKGVTVAFLDSGFFPHPDLKDRIIAYHDVAGEERELSATPRPHQWHGTQTTVVCAGDGRLSDGIYRGLAAEAKLVLVKVSERGEISEENIERGLRWILENRELYGIRVLNISLGGDVDLPCADSKIDRLVEECVKSGIVVIVAAGNTDERRPLPPANSPSAITVGGYSDGNQFSFENFMLYHSSFGIGADGTVKPEIIAPAMYVAAPILPGTDFYRQAELLSLIAAAPDYNIRNLVFQHWRAAGLRESIIFEESETVRRLVECELKQRKIVAAHYQHVDGTSFAAPITASVAAQMLEANPRLSPAAIKYILISTAERLRNFQALRQGYGCLNARRAVRIAREETHDLNRFDYSAPRVENNKILFFLHHDQAKTASLAGDFNGWKAVETRFEKQPGGIWRAEISLLKAGKYRYKFLVNEKHWIEDSGNCLKEPDGFGGFHSILHIK